MPAKSASQERLMEAAAHTPGGYGGVPQKVGKEFVKADSGLEVCAGVLLRAKGPKFLLVKNADDGRWVQPGGHVEAGESLEEAAVRECTEEVGQCPDTQRYLFRKSSAEGVEFTCFLQDVDEFNPQIDAESLDVGWFSPSDIPQSTHPEVARSIEIASGNELILARAIQSGEVSSPQQYENLWLFDVRITGTGTSYREALNEYVYRPPEDFLSDEFLERCNGLPLIFEHPKNSSILNTEEYRDRSIGNVILPYIKGDEVWGIAKVIDADAAQLMTTTHASTSPAVVFRDAGSTETIELSDGKTVLIEGKPSYLDHLAICEAGVWDKGGAPHGVNNTEDMTLENEEKVPAWADALNKRFDEVASRMDAIEQKGGDKFGDSRKDEEKKEEKEEKKDARKDADEKEEKEEKKDARKDSEEEGKKEEKKDARKDGEEKEEKEDRKDRKDSAAENAALKAQIEAMHSRITAMSQPISNEDRDALSMTQRRAENLGRMFGDSIPPPLTGERPIEYRKRLAARFQKYSKTMKAERLDSLDGAVFDMAEERIYTDAQEASRMPESHASGRLIPHVYSDSSGRQITEFSGDIATAFAPFMGAGFVATINRPAKGVN